jgi:hypothetical protein
MIKFRLQALFHQLFNWKTTSESWPSN